ncbi:MAG: Single-stranded-DNA-specific exonuclease RecJ [Alphaproteobacteria bacterium MarineAlpha9_Bin3]|nr:MAG: Single-stranded-DNA-specific exonuclease RecJ [Alphaproteobacteria bacterium MarineAlpha9_Bin3]
MSNYYYNSVKDKTWSLKNIEERKVNKLVQDLQISDFLARIICSRGIDIDKVEGFLRPSLRENLPSPFSITDMSIAVDRIYEAFRSKEKIAIFGDYDVDGATSSAVLFKSFKQFGIEPIIYIPDRQKEGYGPNKKAFQYLKDQGVKLVITVDCGITAFNELTFAKNINLDVIVVDHHMPEAKLPEAIAVVNPNRIDDPTGLGMLAAVGVSFMLIGALKSKLISIGFIKEKDSPNLSSILDLVALGTICDVVPLIGPNRAFVRHGLKIMSKRKNTGINALFQVSDIEDFPNVFHAGFILGPRINAGGRVGEPDLGAKLLTTDNEQYAKEISIHLNLLNEERKKLESEVLVEAIKMADNYSKNDILILHGHNWHSGVIGIVASRIVDQFNKPAIIISENGNESKGSGRSVSGIDIGVMITAAKQSGILVNGGGHPMACGLTIKKEKINDLRIFLNNKINNQAKTIKKEYFVDMAVSVSGAIPSLIKQLSLIEPFGAGNPEPKFIIKDANLYNVKIVGEKHIKCSISDTSNHRLDAIAFRSVGTALGKSLLNKYQAHVIGRLKISEWNGRESLQMLIEDVIEL